MTARILSCLALVLLLFPTTLAAQDDAAEMAMEEAETIVITGADVEYAPIEVPGFDSGMQIAVLSGDPAADGPYTLRLSFPDGYEFPPHWHPMAENVTVLEGTFRLGMGDTVDESAIVEYAAGDYLHIPAEHPHFGGATGWTAVQLHGIGPFAINVVGAEDSAAETD